MAEAPATAAAYLDGTIADYLDKLAGAEPEPGGGSVAALVGALGAGLVTMVTSLTLGKEKFAAVEDDMAAIQEAPRSCGRSWGSSSPSTPRHTARWRSR